MEAIVLAGGLGTRLRQALPDLPKAMAPVAGRPFLEILLTALSRKGVRRVVLSLGYLADTIVEHFGTRFAGMDLAYVVEATPLGTGGAVRLALIECTRDHVFVFNGDTYLDLELAAVESVWQNHRRPILVAAEVADTARYGRLLLNDDRSRICGFTEKGLAGRGLINAGCYVFRPDQLDRFAPHTAFSLERDYLAGAVVQEAFDAFVTSGRFIDIGVPEDFQRAQIELDGILDR